MGTEFFRLHPVLGLLSNLPVVAGVVLMLLLEWAPFRERLERRPTPWLWAAFLITRVGFLVLVVGGLRHVSLDLSTYFQVQGDSVRQGLLPYRDFTTSYAPLFPYLMALPTALPGESLPLFGFFILCDAGALLLLLPLAGELGGPGRRAAVGWLYVAAPVTWYFLVRYAQDEALSTLLLTGVALLAVRGRSLAAGIAAGAAFAATKFTFGVFLPPLALGTRRPLTFLLAAGGAAALLFLPFLAAGAPVWKPLFSESSGIGFGPSLWRLPVVFTPLRLGWWSSLLLGAGLLVVWFRAWPVTRRDVVAPTLATGLVFLILSPKVMPMYITPFWGLAALWLVLTGTAADRRRAALLNLLLGTWWYLDAGGITGDFGPVVQSLAAATTLAIPVFLLLWLRAILTRPVVAAGFEPPPASFRGPDAPPRS